MTDQRLTPLGRRRFLQLLGASTAGLALGACGSASSPAASTTSSATRTTSPRASFPIGAAARAKTKPVPVMLWHSMTENNEKTLAGLAARFNSSQHDVQVSLLSQTSYPDTLTAYTAAVSTGKNLPQLVMIQSIDLQIMIDSHSIVAAGDAVAADHYDLSGIVPSAVEYFKVDGVLWAMPFNESSQVLYYNENAFEKAGLDPAKPPLTLEQYRSYSERIVSTGTAKYGTSLKLTPSNFEDWVAMSGTLFVNNGNGRSARATEVAFGDSTGRQLFSFFAEMLSSKLAQPTPGAGSGGYDNLLAIASNTAPMAIETSAALGTVLTVLGSYKNVKLGLGPLPAPPGPGGVPYGGAGLYIVKQSTAEQQDGAWQFLKFLLEAPQMATWSLGSGYIPITSAAVDVPALKAAWAKTPEYEVAYGEVRDTLPSAATAGAVVGPFTEIETIVTNQLTAISNGTSAGAALAAAVSQSNSAIASYNQRV